MINRFLGDREHQFTLTPRVIAELERVTGAGIGGLCKRLFAGDFKHAELIEVIRLGLIGGGLDPKEAAALVDFYVSPAPIGSVHPLAVDILSDAYFGADAKTEAAE